jgi:hypothetical protein
MKNKYLYLSLIVCTLLGTFTACKKKVVDPNSLSNTERVARIWVCQEAIVTTNSGPQVVYVKGQAGNRLDLSNSFISFNKNGNYEGIDFNNVPQKGIWKFKNNETVAELEEWDYDFLISKLTNKELNFTSKYIFQSRELDISVKMIPKN